MYAALHENDDRQNVAWLILLYRNKLHFQKVIYLKNCSSHSKGCEEVEKWIHLT